MWAVETKEPCKRVKKNMFFGVRTCATETMLSLASSAKKSKNIQSIQKLHQIYPSIPRRCRLKADQALSTSCICRSAWDSRARECPFMAWEGMFAPSHPHEIRKAVLAAPHLFLSCRQISVPRLPARLQSNKWKEHEPFIIWSPKVLKS